MLPEDRLDALLAVRVEAHRERTEWPAANGRDGVEDLQPLLDAADRVADLANEEPTQAFTARLEALFLARAAYLRERHGIAPQPLMGDATPLPLIETPPFIGNDDPTLPGIEWSAASYDATLPDAPPIARLARPFALRSQPVWRRLLWPALAATLLLAIGMTTFTAAALAGPGSPLYGLHKWEQNFQANLTGSAADRTRLRLSNAQDALAALNSAVANHQTGATYDDALATFRDEARAAATSLDDVPAGNERNALSSQLLQLHTTGIADLHAALPVLSWPQRIETTGVLTEIGDQALTVTQADMVYSEHGQQLWTITISGSGFQQGAVLLVNGQPVTASITVTPTKLVARMPGDDDAPRPNSIGVGNPDNTAAVTTSVTSHEENDDDGPPGAQKTPESDDHGGGGHSGSGSSGGSATPTGTGGVDR